MLGHPNAYGLLTQRPVLPRQFDPPGLLPRCRPAKDRGYPDGGADLGRNGTYLVLRTLAQDVAAFDDYVTSDSGGSRGGRPSCSPRRWWAVGAAARRWC